MPRLASLVPPPLRPLARRVRDLLRPPDRTPLDGVLAAADCRAAVEPAPATFLLERRGTAAGRVRVRNFGSAVLSPYGTHPVALTLRWLSSRRDPLDVPAVSVPLPVPLRPGEAADVPVALTAPDFLGHFLVEIDLEQRNGPAFRECGSRPGLVEAQVTGRSADDIDYYRVYATADLGRDYWTVVGPSTKAEFDQLGAVKLHTLQQLGLTPDGRVLDVGCGTGQLAIPMEAFLSDRGCYVGTDIGPEAVAFCRERFRRPTFRFFQSEMTTLPIEGEAFDFVTFFSVFTHTYPDETVLLLAEANRLLAPGGVILGDVFTSPLVERCSGNRGAVELNRDHFLRLVALAGLKAEVLDGWAWQAHGRREVFKYTKLL